MGFSSGSEVKNSPAVLETQEMRVQSLDQEDPLEIRESRQPTLVFLPGESQGQKSLAGYSAWNKESNVT